MLAGVSPTWYTYLEQGRDIRPSPEVLESLARVLQLSEDERRYLYLLANGQVPPVTAERRARAAEAGVEGRPAPTSARPGGLAGQAATASAARVRPVRSRAGWPSTAVPS